jgi:hypothetical protein
MSIEGNVKNRLFRNIFNNFAETNSYLLKIHDL